MQTLTAGMYMFGLCQFVKKRLLPSCRGRRMQSQVSPVSHSVVAASGVDSKMHVGSFFSSSLTRPDQTRQSH